MTGSRGGGRVASSTKSTGVGTTADALEEHAAIDLERARLRVDSTWIEPVQVRQHGEDVAVIRIRRTAVDRGTAGDGTATA